jgi:hypothetical protein
MKPDYSRIPRQTIKTLEAWIAMGRHPDDPFCEAVVMNDLEATIARANKANFEALPQILLWLRQHAPRGSYGSPAALGAWPRVARVDAASKV